MLARDYVSGYGEGEFIGEKREGLYLIGFSDFGGYEVEVYQDEKSNQYFLITDIELDYKDDDNIIL